MSELKSVLPLGGGPPDDPSWLAELPEHSRLAVELAALFPAHVRLSGLADLLSVGAPIRRGWRMNSANVRELFAGINRDTLRIGGDQLLRWRDPERQAEALHSFVNSGRAHAWGKRAAELSRELLRINPYRLDEAQRGVLRAALVGGISEVQIREGCALLLQFEQREPTISTADLLANGGADLDWFDCPLTAQALRLMLLHLLLEAGERCPAMCALAAPYADADPRLAYLLAQFALLGGQPVTLDGPSRALIDASAEALQSSDPAAVATAFEQAIDQLPRERGKRRPPLDQMPGLLQALALAASAPDSPKLRALLRPNPNAVAVEFGTALASLQDWLDAQREARRWEWGQSFGVTSAISAWLAAVLHRWSGLAPPEALLESLQEQLAAMQAAGWTVPARDLADWLDGRPAGNGPVAWVQPLPAWQTVLRNIERLAAPDESGMRSGSRLKVQVGGMHKQRLRIELFEQRPTRKGDGWTIGRALYGSDIAGTLERLPADAAHDRRLLQVWQNVAGGRFDRHFDLDTPLLPALVGHPNVWSVHDTTEPAPLQVERRMPQLKVKRLADGRLRIALDPPPSEHGRRRVIFDDGHLTLIEFDEQHLRLQHALRQQAELPADALPALMAVVPRLAGRVELAADLGLASTVTDLDTRIHVLIEPLGDGLRFSLRVRPLGASGLYLVPGQGAVELLGMRAGEPVRGERRLDAERSALATVLEAAPLLAGAEHGEPIDLTEPDVALELLQLLTELGNTVELAWPASRPRRISSNRGLQQLSLKMRAQRDWFSASGGLALDDGSVVQLSTLLEHLPSSQSRFVRLADDRVIALTQDLARQLRLLRALGEVDRNGIKVAAPAAVLVEPLLDQVADAEIDRAFRQQLKQIRGSDRQDAPIPADFAADLRDYQRDGYRWLMRLAGWGAGALLADDMGLGKTVQALAMLAARAELGPALVIAPTSVIGNWRSEATRFAPSLEVQVYGDGDREHQLESLGPGRLLLVSYGLLAANADAFAGPNFATLVLDEAQAIKNPSTQRAQATRRLQAGFRLAMTGTPIENHLGELWSLMRVLNPGLLGSRERFQQRFVAPIERDARAPERDLLRRLLGPFLLRRLKSQVLDELPPRTEIVLRVEPSAGEAKLLAALRRQAVDRLASETSPGEARRFHVLAELTRLRRAACHPQLVAPELELASSKLDQLAELIAELRDNRHRALVFSQFTDYLALVRERFDADGIGYQYLDGSTPAAQRDAAVRAFQRGDGDVFLLSLKAGGVGLNLTAADYVIHLDPWWNPAVEQQATDRAHRIGQTRPVTVYKLVVAGSIEEQILAMHGDKRELVDAVLQDRAQPERLDVDELVALLAGEGGSIGSPGHARRPRVAACVRTGVPPFTQRLPHGAVGRQNGPGGGRRCQAFTVIG